MKPREDDDEEYDVRPRRRPRRDEDDGEGEPTPHRGGQLLGLGFLGLLVVPLGIWVFFQAWGDLGQMKRGVMDPGGRGQTQVALACGGLSFAFACLLLLGPPLVIGIKLMLGIQ
jgi:hypothetical protein